MNYDDQMVDDERIYYAALEIASLTKRDKYLESACVGRPELLQQVKRLLEARQQRGDFLEVEAAHHKTADGDKQPSYAPHSNIGPYRLQERIGEGGMGDVFLALQESPVPRQVALKILKPGLDSRQILARFDAEWQMLALMDHPNIARIYDAGQDSHGRPYFAMELVRGVAITEFCDSRCMSTKERLQLFGLVCRAVQHAHQKGVIHRDIKPSNVLVTMHDDRPVPKVIDFGVAKALGVKLADASIFTGFFQLVGTPLYMSPEQVEMNSLDIDTRSDIYALGVLLYELLTGCTPFDSTQLLQAGFDELRRCIREVEPPHPSCKIETLDDESASTITAQRGVDRRSLRSALRREIDWMVMKALEKDRERRYQSASEMADDVARYLTHEPINAGPPTFLYRWSKLLRRHRAAAITGLVITMAVLAGSGVSLWHAARARDSERHALANEALARSAVDDMYSEVAEQWLADQAKLTDLQSTFLDKALAFYEPFSQRVDGDPDVQLDALEAIYRVGTMQIRRGRYQPANEAWRRLIIRGETLSRQFPERPEFRLMLLAGHTKLAGSLRRQLSEGYLDHLDLASKYASTMHKTKFKDAKLQARFSEILVMLSLEQLAGDRHEDAKKSAFLGATIAQHLVDTEPKSWQYRSILLNSLIQKFYTTINQIGYDAKEVAPDLNTILQATNSLLAERPTSYFARDIRARVLNELAIMHNRRGELETSLDYLKECLYVREILASEFPEDQDIQLALNHVLENVKIILSCLPNRQAEVIVVKSRQSTLIEDLCRRFPDTPFFRQWHNLERASHLFREGEVEQAVDLYATGLDHDTVATDLVLLVGSLQAWFKKDAEFQKTCDFVLNTAERSTYHEVIHRAVKVCCILPVRDPSCRARIVKEAHRSLQLFGKDGRGFYLMAVGVAEYRNANYNSALKYLSEAEAVQETPVIAATSAYFRAMCLFQQGQVEEARRLVEETAASQMQPLPVDFARPLNRQRQLHHDDIICWLAFLESKQLTSVRP